MTPLRREMMSTMPNDEVPIEQLLAEMTDEEQVAILDTTDNSIGTGDVMLKQPDQYPKPLYFSEDDE